MAAKHTLTLNSFITLSIWHKMVKRRFGFIILSTTDLMSDEMVTSMVLYFVAR